MKENKNIFLAHVVQDDNGNWKEHIFEVHLCKVAEKAKEFASAFGCEDWVYPTCL